MSNRLLQIAVESQNTQPWNAHPRALQTHSLKIQRVTSPLVLILIVILVLAVLGGGVGLRRGNSALAGGRGLVGLVLVILLIMFLTGNL